MVNQDLILGYKKCSIDNCNGKSISLGWCNRHYQRNYKHGSPHYFVQKTVVTPKTRSLYNIWRTMIKRCHNPQDKDYAKYGGRGIKVCDRWRYSLDNFVEDMNPRPSLKHSIDRINNDGNYEPNNCRWATILEQAYNKRMLKTNTTGVKGVSYIKKSKVYYATVTVNKKTIYLGSYKTVEEAKIARLAGELQYYGRHVS